MSDEAHDLCGDELYVEDKQLLHCELEPGHDGWHQQTDTAMERQDSTRMSVDVRWVAMEDNT